MPYMSAAHASSMWLKSVAQSATGPVVISLRRPMPTRLVNRLSADSANRRSGVAVSPLVSVVISLVMSARVMSMLHVDGHLGAVHRGDLRLVLGTGGICPPLRSVP